MLVLSRKTSQRILIGDDVAITIVRIGPMSVRIGIEAPKSMNICREEIAETGHVQKQKAPIGPLLRIGDPLWVQK